MSGPPGNTQGVTERAELTKQLSDPKYKMLGNQPFEVTNWDPSLTHKVLTADIAKYPKIDVIVSDFGPSLVCALPEFRKSGRTIPAVVASDGNVLSGLYEDNKDANPTFKLTVATGNDNVRLAIDYAVAKATGGTPPTNLTFEAPSVGVPEVGPDGLDPAVVVGTAAQRNHPGRLVQETVGDGRPGNAGRADHESGRMCASCGAPMPVLLEACSENVNPKAT